MIGLTPNGKPTELLEAGNTTFVEACVYYGYEKQYKNYEAN